MELVKGIPITRYCDEQQLNPRERLELFMPVCQAIQHAHQKGIIHRDVKPSNVLVANYDGKPVPKVIDFGVAKAVGQTLTDRTLFTGFGAMIGTLEYMSPEQASWSALDIDTRSDIYSLGVLLYELLTGTPPITRQRLRQAGLEEALRLIREEEPPKPSTRLSESKDALTTAAALRKTEPLQLTRIMRGEPDWIVMKALDKDRERRYETANSLAQDIQRYLCDEPVLAVPPSIVYRLRKFAKRHKGGLAAAALVLLALLCGIVGTTLGLLEARSRRAEAEKAAGDMQAVLEFFETKVLSAARPIGQEGGLGPGVTIRAAVDRVEPTIAGAFADKPLVEASIRDALGVTYLYLNEGDLALKQHGRALELRRANLGPDHQETLSTMNNLASAYQSAGRLQDALPIFQELVGLSKTKLGADHPETLTHMSNLGIAYLVTKQLDDAIALLKQTLELQKNKLAPNHRGTLITMNNLASAYQAAGRLQDALPIFEEALRLSKMRPGLDHPDTLTCMNNLGIAFQEAGRLRDAVALLEKALELRQATLTPDHPHTLDTMMSLASAYQDQEEYAESEHLLIELLARRRKSGADLSGTLSLLGLNHLKRKKYAEAESVLRECHALREKTQRDDWRLFNAKSQLGGSLLGQKKYADARPLLLEGYDGMKQRKAKIPPGGRPRLLEAMERIVELYDATDQPEGAIKWRRALDERRKKPAR